jgi:CRP/FNR family transcriptional regulator, anaerobic regulatory protein
MRINPASRAPDTIRVMNDEAAFRGSEGRCPACGVRNLCLPARLDESAARDLDRLFGGPRRLARRESLFRAGEPIDALHAVRVGTLKTVMLTEDGREQITGYHMAGDIVGLDELGRTCHLSGVVALEDSEVCTLPLDRLDALVAEPALLQTVMHLMASQLRRGRDLAVVLGSLRADERVATFLLDLARRHGERGFSASELVLRMTREEIASFLGLKLETVSRIFSRLQGEGLIQVQGRAVKLLDPARLRELAGLTCEPLT